MRAYGATNKGKLREKNEDSYDIIRFGENGERCALIIADGMGGHQAGEIASESAINAFKDYVMGHSLWDGEILDFMTEALRYANTRVFEKSVSDEHFSGMGTTFTACIVKEGKGYVVHVGDSRLYLLNENRIKMITTDHSYVNEMVKAGQITQAEALVHPGRNALTRAIGVGPIIEIDGYIFEFSSEDTIIMCTDGLTNMVEEDIIRDLVLHSDDIEKCAQNLIEVANNNGGLDNITVILAQSER